MEISHEYIFVLSIILRLFFIDFSTHSSNSLTRITHSSRIKIINGHSRYFYGCIINISKVMRSTKDTAWNYSFRRK